MNRTIIVVLITTLSLLLKGCNTTEPPPPPNGEKPTLELILEDVSCIEAWIQLTTTNLQLPATIKLKQINPTGDTISYISILNTKDSLLYVDSLLPNKNYQYQVSSNQCQVSSNELSVTTMDTTSHNFTWQEFIIGEWGSQLIDVWGTDENNVYACGSVTINDTVYGILKWNGSDWLPEKRVGGLSAIFGFSNSDIWAVGGGVWYFNGQDWISLTLLHPVLIENIPYTSVWGTCSSNIYFGSGRGTLIHWNGQSATVFANLSTQRISDVYGLSSDFILASTSALASPGEVFLYNGLTWTRFDELNENLLYNSVYAVTTLEFYTAGVDLLLYRNGNWTETYQLGPVMECIRGNKQTGDIVTVGHFATILHYNGASWKEFQFSTTEYSPLTGVYLTEDKIFAVGSYSSNQARIIIGTRN